MKRVSITEDWSRFNRAVLEAADGVARRAAPQKPVPPPPVPPRELSELVPEPGGSGDPYGLIARHKWRKHA